MTEQRKKFLHEIELFKEKMGFGREESSIE